VEFIFAKIFETAIEVDIVEGGLEDFIIVAMWVLSVSGDFTSPVERAIAQTTDYKEYLAFIGGVGARTQFEGKGALCHEVAIFRNLAVKFRWRGEFGLLGANGIHTSSQRSKFAMLVFKFVMLVFKFVEALEKSTIIRGGVDWQSFRIVGLL
jgi:hypothetical protein